ncbi:uncharacterized protein DUF4221 [Natronoflexus pectinivorans]|uniref:Uncharacterized protein DUF4221 n=2 Tax=Natronoflexus pectinivorans TaxID=682526 RepID=A0A4R2GGU9_9BACT|nr:uncharacterized protein DUF4221 [Natronoflexus pectinivorans]
MITNTYKFYVLIMTFLSIMSCNNKAIFIESSQKLSKQDSLLSIKIPPNFHSQSKFIQVLEEDSSKNILAYGSNNQIHFFCLESLSLQKSTYYQQYGPEGIATYTGFHVINMDSVVLTSQTSVILADTYGKILQKLDFIEWNSQHTNQPYLIFAPSRGSRNSAVRINDNIFFLSFQFDLKSDDFKNTPIGLYYNIKDNSMNEAEMKYPEFPSNYTSLSHNPTMAIKDNCLIYSFSVLDEIYLFDKTKGVTNKQNFSSFNRVSVNNISDRNSLYHQIKRPRYLSIKYDPWNDVFYRIFYPGFEVSANNDDSYYFSLIATPPVFSVIIIDSEFNIIGETTMPFQHYDPYSNFITKDGLFFGLHENHPEFDPDYLRFARFTVELINQ